MQCQTSITTVKIGACRIKIYLEIHYCVLKIHRQLSPVGIWLPIVPMGTQIFPAGIHITPAGIENIHMGIEIIPVSMISYRSCLHIKTQVAG